MCPSTKGGHVIPFSNAQNELVLHFCLVGSDSFSAMCVFWISALLCFVRVHNAVYSVAVWSLWNTPMWFVVTADRFRYHIMVIRSWRLMVLPSSCACSVLCGCSVRNCDCTDVIKCVKLWLGDMIALVTSQRCAAKMQSNRMSEKTRKSQLCQVILIIDTLPSCLIQTKSINKSKHIILVIVRRWKF